MKTGIKNFHMSARVSYLQTDIEYDNFMSFSDYQYYASSKEIERVREILDRI